MKRGSVEELSVAVSVGAGRGTLAESRGAQAHGGAERCVGRHGVPFGTRLLLQSRSALTER
eukprot:351563-Chlamydomonas_euryale.AAC.5